MSSNYERFVHVSQPHHVFCACELYSSMRFSKNKWTRSDDGGDTIGVSSICLYRCSLFIKCVFFTLCLVKSMMSSRALYFSLGINCWFVFLFLCPSDVPRFWIWWCFPSKMLDPGLLVNMMGHLVVSSFFCSSLEVYHWDVLFICR